LVLMIDPGPDEAGRDALAQDVRGRIEGKGTLKHENKWGLRKMAYEIGKSNEADYRWFRFEAPSELLDELNHNLKIADGVLRFRIFKVDADAPVLVPPMVAAPAPGASRDRDRGDRGPQSPPPAAVAAESADEPVESAPEPAAAESAPEPAESAPESADVPAAPAE
jgi:small subunit ribosomal protein S6